MLYLDSPPPGVSADLWSGGAPVGAPQVGELWVLSWDGAALALGLVARTAPSFVTCWPVTFADEPVFAPAVRIDSPLGVPVHVWPTRETGLGIHMLHRCFGSAMSVKTMVLIANAMDDEPAAEMPMPLADHTVSGDAAEAASDEMLENWEQICLNVWPEPVPGTSAFGEAMLQSAGLEPSRMATLLDVTLPDAVSLMRGEAIPTSQQVEAVAEALSVHPHAVLASGETEGFLASPDFKAGFVNILRSRSITEAAARELVRADLALAARSTGDLKARVIETIERIERGA